MARFRLAVDRIKADGSTEAEFFTIACWRGAAEFAVNHLSVGRLVLVAGVLRAWQPEDGGREIVYVEGTVRALDPKPQEEKPQKETKPEAKSRTQTSQTSKPASNKKTDRKKTQPDQLDLDPFEE